MNDAVDSFFRGIGDVRKANLITREDALRHHKLEPMTHSFPEFLTHEDQREWANFSALNKGGGLEKLVECTEAARHHNKRAGVLHEADLAGEEVSKLNTGIHMWIGALLVGKNDIQAVASPTGFMRPPVGRH